MEKTTRDLSKAVGCALLGKAGFNSCEIFSFDLEVFTTVLLGKKTKSKHPQRLNNVVPSH